MPSLEHCYLCCEIVQCSVYAMHTHLLACRERFEKGHHQTDLKVRNVVLPAGSSCVADKACEWLVAARGGSICGGGGGLLRSHVTVAHRGPCIG